MEITTRLLLLSRRTVHSSAFFNGMDFRLSTYTGGPTWVPGYLGGLQSPGSNKPACQGFRLDGSTYVNTDASGNPIIPSTPQKTVTYNTDWTTKTFAETFDKFDISDPLKAPGWLCEPVRTNKVTCRKSNPVDLSGVAKSGDAAAVLSVVDDNAALTVTTAAAIFTSGKAYELNNSSGDTFATVLFGGQCGNTNAHSGKCLIRLISGPSTSYLSFSGVNAANISSQSYQQYEINNVVPLNTAQQLNIRVQAGCKVRFILPQLEEGPFCTSPICKASDGSDPLTSLTRAATVASSPTAGKIPVNNFAIRMIVVPMVSGRVGYLWSSWVDATTDIRIIVSADNNVIFRKKISNVAEDAIVGPSVVNNSPIDLICVHSANLGMQVSARRYSSSWGSFTNGTVNGATAAKANALITSTYQLGSINGGAQFTGNISLFDCVPIPSGITDPMAWAKTHWGVT